MAIIHALTHVKNDPFTDVYGKKRAIGVLNLLTKLAGDNSSEMSKLRVKKKKISNIESVSDNGIFKILLIKSLGSGAGALTMAG